MVSSRGNDRSVRRRRNFIRKPPVCPFCTGKATIDYQNASALSQYISSRGKIGSRRRTKACAKHQRKLAQAIKRARFLALLPYAPSHIWETGGVGIRRPMY
ncbi:MAG: 30S ribosomal protein S18 [Dehalococcoidia bacterium]|nr:30S ribosomal protein S18 [Dehalococcoidia bacterium]